MLGTQQAVTAFGLWVSPVEPRLDKLNLSQTQTLEQEQAVVDFRND